MTHIIQIGPRWSPSYEALVVPKSLTILVNSHNYQGHAGIKMYFLLKKISFGRECKRCRQIYPKLPIT